MFYVYLIKSKNNSNMYIGCTKNLIKRLSEHNQNLNTATKKQGPI